MLTFRTGAAGAPSAAKAMGEHLLQQTLSPEMAEMAAYYQQGMSPPTPAEAAASRYAREAMRGHLPNGSLLDEIVMREVDRLAETAVDNTGRPIAEEELRLRALGVFVAAGMVDRDEAVASLNRNHAGTMRHWLDQAVEDAKRDKDYSSATATPRRDMNPSLAARLGIDLGRSMNAAEIANLLNGQRADGDDIEGKQKRRATEAIGIVFGMSEDRLPTRAELENVLAGRKVDGTPLARPDETARAVRRFQSVLGARHADLTPGEREAILSGCTASGGHLTVEQYHERMDTSRARIGYIDFTFSAPKSVSVAWAFAATEGERGIILQAHHDAIKSVMGEIETHLGQARKGDGGRDGVEQGAIAWVSFDHFTARPTVAVPAIGKVGEAYTELITMKQSSARIAGDMQLHTHTAVMNAVLTESGRLGGLNLGQVDGRLKEWGALYQAFLAQNLRQHGVDAGLDERTGMAKLNAIPESVVEHFSKRTMGGTAAAKDYAASQGLDWDTLDAARKIGLLKQGVQDPRGAKSDDLSDMRAWVREAEAIGYRHESVLRPDVKREPVSESERLDLAYRTATKVFETSLERRATVDGADTRIAAAKGLIAAGIESAADVDAVTKAFRERGVTQRGQVTRLIWGDVTDGMGRQKVVVTTELHRNEEWALIGRVQAAGADRSAALTPKQIADAVEHFPELDFSSDHGIAQRAVVERLGTGGRFAVAVGVAGSGKTTLLKPLVHAWKEDGRDVHGIALAWRQSVDLKDAGIEAFQTRAVASFLAGLEAGRIHLTKRSVVVIDELGLLGTRKLNTLLCAQEAHSFQIVGLGDPKQMQSVEAGAVFDLLRRALGDRAVPKLETSVRQMAAEERETVLMFREGRTADAVARKVANDTLRVVAGDYDATVKAVATLWQERREANANRPGYTLSVSAPTNRDAHEISAAIRGIRRERGEIGADKIVIPVTDAGGQTRDLPLAIGDRVRLFERANAKFTDGSNGNIGNNGSVLEIAEIRDAGLLLRTKEGREGLVQWSTLQSKQSDRIMLAYGDVLTIHTSQGSTVTDHIFAMPAGSAAVTAFGAYTSGSRHRELSFVVTSDGAERSEIARHRPLGDGRQISAGDVIDNIARNLARQPEKDSAIALIERAENVRRGAVGELQGCKQKAEVEAASGMLRLAPLTEGLRRHREEARLTEIAKAVVKKQEQRKSLAGRVKAFAADIRQRLQTALVRLTKERLAEEERLSKTQKRGLRL